jgi:hypothetical protein
MKDRAADKKADMEAVLDRGESVGLMGPMLLAEDSRHRGALTDLALDLAAKSSGFRRSGLQASPCGMRSSAPQ